MERRFSIVYSMVPKLRIRRGMKIKVCKGAAILAAAIYSNNHCDAFMINRPLRSNHRTIPQRPVTDRKTPLHMGMEPSSFMIASPLFSGVALAPTISKLDPFLQAELFQDAAHFALDFASLLGPATLAIRFLAVIGRIFVMASDYVPDHTMMPEELLFQMAMLFISSAALVRSIPPVFSHKQLTMRDRKSYASLFRPAGVSWMQYQVLVANAMDWIDVPSGAMITSDETSEEDEQNYLYWLYKGKVEIQSSGETLQCVSTKTGFLFGNLTFVSRSANKPDYPKTTALAGADGATLLRIDVIKLKSMMKQDNCLDQAVRNIILDAMQAQIASLLSTK